MKAMLKHAPTIAMVEPRWLSSLISVAMAFAICTFPSLNPPMTRLAKNVRKSDAPTHSVTLNRLPAIDHNNAALRPYLSDRNPMTGAAKACNIENSDPKAPPKSITSYWESIGFAKAFLYAFR